MTVASRAKRKNHMSHRATAQTPSPSSRGPRAADAALIIFAKAPIPGQVKTRLCPPLTEDEAATLHGSFVLDSVERSRDAIRQARLHVDRFVACSPSVDHAFFKILEARYGVHLLPQIGEDLGIRMHGALETVLTRGYKSALVVGTDIPNLPLSCYGEAFTLLADRDLVLGPALDGGYYAIGMKQPIPELFSDIPWSTDQVTTLTVKKAEALGLRVAFLPQCRDVDVYGDLLALIHASGLGGPHKARDQVPVKAGVSRRTAGVLEMLAARLRSREQS